MHCAASGEHAIAVLSTHDIDAMVLDLHLPGLEGAEVLRLLREQGLTLPILLISASHSGRATKLVGANGAQDFLPKPFENDELDRWVTQWVGLPYGGRTWHGTLCLLHHQSVLPASVRNNRTARRIVDE